MVAEHWYGAKSWSWAGKKGARVVDKHKLDGVVAWQRRCGSRRGGLRVVAGKGGSAQDRGELEGDMEMVATHRCLTVTPRKRKNTPHHHEVDGDSIKNRWQGVSLVKCQLRGARGDTSGSTSGVRMLGN